MSTAHRSELNKEQIEAVETIDGPLLIIAGAGSGKTRVITYRIAYMLSSGIPQKAILALTFTNKAAREMQERVRELTGKKLAGLTISTFHAFGVRVLRSHIHRLGYRENFSIYDVADQHDLLKETAREIGFSLESVDTTKLLALFSRVKTGMMPMAELAIAYQELYREYQSHMKLYNAVDFDDLIALPIKLLESLPDVLVEYRNQFHYVLVDEFQDTSRQQYRFMKLLGHSSGNVCVVGDDDQSIYSWRGADFGNILEFEKDFPGCREIKLERNYRSTDTILAAANGVISHNKNRKGKNLWTGTKGGKPIELYYPEDDRQEGLFIAEKIKTLAMREGLKYHDVGVLVRTNSLFRSLEEAFLAENIPYRTTGGQSFFQRKEIKDIIAYLRLMANPDDDISLLRVLNTPRRGIGKRTLEQITELAVSRGASLHTGIQAALHAADSPLPKKAQADLHAFLDLIEEYRPRFLAKKKLAETLKAFVEDIDYWAYLVAENQKSDKAAKWKYRNIEIFIGIVRDYERDPDNQNSGVFDFLNRISLNSRDDQDAEDPSGKINLMTIHAAKGLEHEVVFLAGVEEHLIPHARAIEDNPDNIEEERRLFYVAITRARQKLFITACRKRRVMREVVESLPSPFLEEIPESLMQVMEMEEPVETDEAVDYFARIKAQFASRS